VAADAPYGVSIREGRLRAAGGLEDYRLEVEAALEARGASGRLRLAGWGDLRGLTVDSLRAELLEGELRGNGRLVWQPWTEWTVTVAGDGLSPGSLLADPGEWPGSLTLRARSEGRIGAGGTDARIQIDTLYGELRRRPVGAKAVASADSTGRALVRLDALWGSAEAHVDGEIGAAIELEFDLDAPNLRQLQPRATGALAVSGRVEGPRSAPALRGVVSAAAVGFGSHRLERLTGRVELDLADPGTAVVDLEAARLVVSGRRVGSLVVRAHGSRGADDTAAVLIDELRADVLGGRVEAEGWATWQPQPAWRVTLTATDVAPATLMPDPAQWPGALSLRGSSEGTVGRGGVQFVAEVDTVYGSLRGQSIAGRMSAAADGSGYRFDDLRLSWGSAYLRASGSVGDRHDLALDLRVPDLAVTLPGASGALSVAARVGGTPALPTVSASLDATGLAYGDGTVGSLTGRASLGLAAPDAPEFELEARGAGFRRMRIEQIRLSGSGIRSARALEGVTVDSIQAAVLDGHVRASGQVVWRPRIEWRIDLEGDSLAPGSLFRDPSRWPGRLALSASAEWALAAEGPIARLEIDTLVGSLRDQPVSAKISAAVDGDAYSVPHALVTWGRARLRVDGEAADELDARFDFDVPDLAAVVPGASGAARISGSLAGPRTRPSSVARLAAENVVFGTYRLGELGGTVDIDLGEPGSMEFGIEARRIVSGERSIDRLSLEGRGTSVANEILIRIAGPEPSLDVELAGGIGDGQWLGELRRLDLRNGTTGDWQLDEPVRLSAARTAFDLERTCLRSDESAVCVAGAWRAADGWRLSSTVQALPLTVTRAFLPARWSVEGTLDGDFEIAVAGDRRLTGTAGLVVGPGTISYPLGTDSQTVSLEGGALNIAAGASGVRADAELSMTGGRGASFGNLEARLTLPEYTTLGSPSRDQPIAGRVQARFDDLSLVEALTTRVTRTQGRLELDLDAEGTVGAPSLQGELRLRDASFDIPTLGTRVRDVAFTAVGDGSGSVNFSGEARSGPGRVEIRGQSPLKPTTESPTRVRVLGDRFEAVNTAEARVLVSPDITVEAAGRRITVGGDVFIPLARVDLGDLPQPAVPVSRDAVIVGATGAPASQLAVAGRVRITLGDEVSFRGRGLTARLAGSLLAIEEPDRPTAGSGELSLVDGRYRAYGQDLRVDPGRLIFGGGPIDNPALDLRAYRVVSDTIIAGLLIRGTLRSPEVTLFSQPAMAESDALSYLILGRPLGETTFSERDLVTRAATSSGLRGGNFLARRIAATFGLEAEIEAGRTFREASLVAGKYLSPRLYVAGGIGIFDHVSTFRVRYLLSGKWTLVGETGRGTSTDLVYRLERGR
ncbi:MAG: translocation/assembly module TamB domain-containing protein, partial [Gemmatimonadales bacterium]